MSPETFPELSPLRVVLAPHVRDRHLAALTRALRLAPDRPRAPGLAWRRRAAAAAAAGALLTPAAAVAASDDALPGDALYAIKRLLEPVVAVFDRDVVAEHRVEELEVLVARDPSSEVVADLLVDARVAVRATDSPDLSARLEMIEAVIDRAATAVPIEAVIDAPLIDSPVTTLSPTHRDPAIDNHRRGEDEFPSTADSTDQPPSTADAPLATTTTVPTGRETLDETEPLPADAGLEPASDAPVQDGGHEGSRDVRDSDGSRVDGDRAP